MNGTAPFWIILDYDVFVRAEEPQRGVTSRPDEWDLRLRPGSAAVDAGVRLPNVNDEFTDTTPDLGACELSTSPGRNTGRDEG